MLRLFLILFGVSLLTPGAEANRVEWVHSGLLGRKVEIALHEPTPEALSRWRAVHGDGKLRIVLFLPGGFDEPKDLLNHRIFAELSRREAAGEIVPSLWVAMEHFWAWYADRKDGHFPFARFLTEELLPQLEERFPALGGARTARSVAGLSMGGFGALNLCGRTQLFSRCAALSPAVAEPPFKQAGWWVRRSLVRAFPLDPEAFAPWNPWKHLGGDAELVLGCGLQDKYGLAEPTRDFARLRTQAGRPPVKLDLRPGDHQWSYWTKAFLDLAPWLAGTPGREP